MSNPFYKGIEFRWEEHKRLWNWLAENPEKSKSNWPEWKRLHSDQGCFACDFHFCAGICPFKKKCSPCLDGLFLRWVDAIGFNLSRYRLAKQIANLPLRDDLDWKTSTGEPYGSR